ncbi:UDP-4-amino-4,6-dideoxy-N-acetyl-beta-L-altrosamine N-acetyltransferase [Pseudomonas sp. FW215-R2]|uniref:UDP-4-amino-4, 6-dideoxy-N-acetyl-beta-L-altrosamine N-acetyltransferase n=1 Tax=unclassified Pseudomonas TaxID=196821 RepID=UPI000C87EBF9|nr:MULTISPECIES: UDP-4-amino-4,6-dideoxy-N-acetyl-beta-L-altrosamine N-acetyltransferase [unclassified Pseudomonas]PMW96602.1 UDP-4-amino-4,6-dideoxy-N-acetyl-beta-L-altrosamine N-acetyltransferase [Pseudomonas sp. FW215-R2]PMX05990.1 UDP-4-amino-4,6-dideoxy-N-acetyl-beta-L-altrosamine N-acetyltransferase [Pseudomonas sp. FW215-L1]PMX15547.1 UDP-4-amino-4,6-dideoxy-N-acetyl-beta-L-altrosamine N-acetyltransferase [Pseudomonas sp. FW215-E1]PNA22631.1 UDP-4-amino-4,6-dideoxy-N-acetyl-beta-L-altros
MQFVPLTEANPAIQAHVRTLRNQEDVRKYMYTSHEISDQEHANWLTSLKGNSRQQVFVVLKDERAVGVVSLNAINTVQKTADWAFYLDVQLQGKGLGSVVEFWMLDYAFAEAGLEKLNCEVLASNPAVVKMHQKFGFELEGVRRQNILKDGERIDVVLLGITKDEWLSKRPALQRVVERIGAI